MRTSTPGGTRPLRILECREFVHFLLASRAGDIPAVIDFNLALMRGEAHGLVGESGCGKSTIALAIMRYLGNSGRIVAGQILFQGRDIVTMGQDELRRDPRRGDRHDLSGTHGIAELPQ